MKWKVTAAQPPPVGEIVEACWKVPSIEGFIILDSILDSDGKWKMIPVIMAMGNANVPAPAPPNFWRPQDRGPDIDGVEVDESKSTKP